MADENRLTPKDMTTETTMNPRLRELIDRLVAPGPGGRVGSASEGHELHRLVEELDAEREASDMRAGRMENVVACAQRLVIACAGARLRRSILDKLDPLLVALHKMPAQDVARCLRKLMGE